MHIVNTGIKSDYLRMQIKSLYKLFIGLTILASLSSCNNADYNIEDKGNQNEDVNKHADITYSIIDPDDRHIFECHQNCAIYFLREGIINIGYLDMKQQNVQVMQGMLITGAEAISWIENLTSDELDYILIKSLVNVLNDDPPGPNAYEVESSNLYLHEDDEQTRRILDNKYFNIIELNIMPNETIEPRHYLSGTYFPLNAGGKIEHVLDTNRTIIINTVYNKTWWMDSSKYMIKNKDTLPAELLFIGIKPAARYAAYEP